MEVELIETASVATQTEPPVIEPFRLYDLPRELRDLIFNQALMDTSSFKLFAKRASRTSDDDTGSTENENERPSSVAPQSATDSLTANLSANEAPPPQPLGLVSSVKYRPSTNIMCSSKLMKHEYDRRAKQAMTLVLTDNENYSFQHVTLPEQVKDTYWLELNLILFCHNCFTVMHTSESNCQAAREIDQHLSWISNLLTTQLPELRSFTVNAYLSYDKYRFGKSDKVPCEKIVKRQIRSICDLPKLESLRLYKYEWSTKPDFEGPKALIMEWLVKKTVKCEKVEKVDEKINMVEQFLDQYTKELAVSMTEQVIAETISAQNLVDFWSMDSIGSDVEVTMAPDGDDEPSSQADGVTAGQ